MNDLSSTGDQREIIETLGISDCSPELKQKILASFGQILFKRLLLLLPDDVARNVIDEITALPIEEGMERLITLLDKHVPDATVRRGETLERIITEFRSRP